MCANELKMLAETCGNISIFQSRDGIRKHFLAFASATRLSNIDQYFASFLMYLP